MPLVKTIGSYAIAKGMLLGIIAVDVIGNQNLSTLVRALIVAAFSGLLGAAGMALAAFIAGRLQTRANERAIEVAIRAADLAEENRQLLAQLARHQAGVRQAVEKLKPEAPQ